LLPSCVALRLFPPSTLLCLLQLYLVTRFLEFIQPDLGRLSLGGILSDIRTSMMDEVDFTKVRWGTGCMCRRAEAGWNKKVT